MQIRCLLGTGMVYPAFGCSFAVLAAIQAAVGHLCMFAVKNNAETFSSERVLLVLWLARSCVLAPDFPSVALRFTSVLSCQVFVQALCPEPW